MTVLTSLSKQFETKSSYAFGLFDLKERYLGTLVIDYVIDKYVLKDEKLTEKDLEITKPPTVNECEKFGLDPIYLSYFGISTDKFDALFFGTVLILIDSKKKK